jgi:hypothetical protein
MTMERYLPISLFGKALFLVSALLGGALIVPRGVAMAEKAIPEVLVTNTPDNPVPAAIVGTPAVTLSQSGPIAVDIGPLRDHAPAQPFDANVHLDAGISGWPLDSAVLLEVPEGKTAVIETASAWFLSELGLVPRLDISQAIIGVGSSRHYVALTQESTAAAPSRPDDKRSIFAGTQTLRLYAPPGSTVRANLFVPMLVQGDPTSQIVGTVSVTGYFVDTPSTQ